MLRRRLPRLARAAAAVLFSPARRFSQPRSPRRVVALWGNGDYGRLGLGSLASRWEPTVLPFFSDDDDCPVSVSCGGAHSLFLTEKGRVYASGLNNFGQLGSEPSINYTLDPVEVPGLPYNVVKIYAGYYHSAALTDEGELFMWGNNSSGQLGFGKRSGSIVSNPTRLESLVDVVVKMVALGSDHSIALTDGGDVLSWGQGGSGRLGHGQNLSEYIPRLIKNFEDVKIKYIAAGMLHSACIDDNGSVFLFGEWIDDRISFRGTRSTSNPHHISELPYCRVVACGGYHTCVITSEDTLYAWGSNENGCLGLGYTDIAHLPQKVQSSDLQFPVLEVSCGWKHTAIVSDSQIFTWGWGGTNGAFFDDEHSSGGQLGHGSDLDSCRPVRVKLGSNCKALKVSCGFNHTGAILEQYRS